MKKAILSAILLTFIISFAKAQSGNKTTWSLGPEVNFPFNTGVSDDGETRAYYQNGIGGALKVELPVSQALHITASAGYVHYFTNIHYLYLDPLTYVAGGSDDNNLPKPPPYLFLPIKAGLQYYYSKYMYLDAQTGAAIKLNSVSKTSLIYSGGLGGVIPFSPKSGLDIGVRYERGYEIAAYQHPMSQIGVRIAYKRSF